MAHNQHLRLGDNINMKQLKLEGFRTRKRTPLQMLLLFITAVVIITSGIMLIVQNDSYIAAAASVIMGCALLFIGLQFETLKKAIKVSELMNALLSSVASKHHRFVMITEKDGHIIFFNRPFQDIFPDFAAHPKRTLEGFFELYSASEQRHDLLEAVKQGNEKRTGIILGTGHEKKPEPISILVEPIDRFPEFMLLRGQ